MNQAEKMEIIRLVEQSDLSVKATLQALQVSCASFYRWRSAAAVQTVFGTGL